MRIISNFKDSYDFLQDYNETRCIFVRKFKDFPIEKEDLTNGRRRILRQIEYACNCVKNDGCRALITRDRVEVVLAIGKKQYCFKDSDYTFVRFVNSEITDSKKKLDPYHNKLMVTNGVINTSEFNELLIKLETPYLIYNNQSFYISGFYISQIGEMGFFQGDPNLAYDAIRSFVGNELNPENRVKIPVGTDEERKQSAGFDSKSFITSPTGRKRKKKI